MKTKEQIKQYNKEYCSRPSAIAKAKARNALLREKRKLYKKTPTGKENENKYRRKRYSQIGFDRHLWQRYKITIEEYNSLFELQKGLCAICGIKKKEKLHVDHSHETNKVRGLLCGACNRALGLLKDNVEFLIKAILYLKK